MHAPYITPFRRQIGRKCRASHVKRACGRACVPPRRTGQETSTGSHAPAERKPDHVPISYEKRMRIGERPDGLTAHVNSREPRLTERTEILMTNDGPARPSGRLVAFLTVMLGSYISTRRSWEGRGPGAVVLINIETHNHVRFLPPRVSFRGVFFFWNSVIMIMGTGEKKSNFPPEGHQRHATCLCRL